MTDRASSGGTLPNACPFLALDEDRDRRSAVPDGRHRCFAESSPQPRALTYQESYCLSTAFPACRSFLDWAARAAAEPLLLESRPGPVTAPLAPVPSTLPPPPPPVAPVQAAPGSRLPPPPAGYAPPPAWQPPGSVRADAGAFTWASPPPWVAEPELKSTAALPSAARPPLDPERPGWAGSPPPTPVPYPAEPLRDPAVGAPGDPAASSSGPASVPPSGAFMGTFASRRAGERPAPAPPPHLVPAEPAPLPPPLSLAPPPPLPTPLVGDPDPAPPVDVTDEPVVAGADARHDEEPTGTADTWRDDDADQRPPAPVAIPVGAGPSDGAGVPAWEAADDDGAPAATETWSGSWDAGAVPPPADPTVPPQAPPGGTGRERRPSSRWLPSFLSREAPPPDAGTDPMAYAGGVSVAAVATDSGPDSDAWTADPVEAQPGGAWAEREIDPGWSDAPGAPPMHEGTEPVAGGEDGGRGAPGTSAAALPDAELTAPLSPRPRRLRRGGVAMDAQAPVGLAAQTSSSTRTSGSGEWNRSRRQRPRTGWRRFLPGIVPPVALAAVGLFLAAAFLFLVPGFFAGGDAGTAPPATGGPGVVAATLAPGVTAAPATDAAPDASFRTYTVERGDTLFDIARRFAVTQEQLECVNQALRRNPNLLSVGQELAIPPQDYRCPRRNNPRP